MPTYHPSARAHWPLWMRTAVRAGHEIAGGSSVARSLRSAARYQRDDAIYQSNRLAEMGALGGYR